MSLYIVVTPDRLPEARVLLNLLVSRIVTTNTREQLHARPELRYSCLLLLDEIAALGYVPIIDKAAAYIRGYGLRLLSICQSEGQLRADPPRGYGREGARSLTTNHAARIIYTPTVQEDAEEYSSALGFETVRARTTSIGGRRRQHSESEQRRALMLEQELRMMPPDEQIILAGGVRPIKCVRIRYYLDETFIGRLREVSPSLRAIGKRLPTREEIETAVEVGELAVHVPRIDLDHHQAVTERRVRVMGAGDVADGADLARVAVPLDAVPVLEESATDADVDAIVTGFWSALEAAGDIEPLGDDALADSVPEGVDPETGEWLGGEGPERPALDLAALRDTEQPSDMLDTERA